MEICNRSFRLATLSLLGAWLISGSPALSGAGPALDVQRDPSGVKITWNATDGRDYVLEASQDFATWSQVNQSVVKEGSLHRVFVPDTEAKGFYRLVNDGVRKQAAYVGSATCKLCHSDIHDKFVESGHGYKLIKVNGAPPTYYSSQTVQMPDPPAGWTWNDVSYVIGGANWKGRVIDNNGYIVTGSAVQFNLANQSWSAYESTVPLGTKPYDCGKCHTTGWVTVQNGGVHQDGLPGMMGSFAAAGVQCEACHGPGGLHFAGFGDKSQIIKDTSAALCGRCHVRGAANTIPSKGGFIEHHEQYNEILSAGHAGVTCVTCHDPHVSATRGLPGAIKLACTACHTDPKYTQDNHNLVTDCTTCHMPRATKSAVAVNKYTADLKTHIFKINTSATGEMFTADGLFANGGTGVTLSYVCYQCHKDTDGVGGSGSTKTLTELATKATGFHN